MGLVQVRTDKRGFATPVTPVSSGGMLRHAISFETILNDMLNGEQEFRNILFATATAKTISGGVITPTLRIHTVTSESGTSDDLDTITAVNNTYLILKATATHTITLKHATGNINVPGLNNVVMTGNAAVLLFCENGQWGHIGTYSNKNNFIATTDPGSGDDTGDGYLVGSVWLNTQRDRLWICVDNTSTTAIWKPLPWGWKGGFRYRGAAAVAQGIGIATPTISGSTVSSNNTSANTFVQCIANAGTSTLIETTTFNLIRLDHDPVVEFYVAKTPDNSNPNKFWVGLTSTGMTASDTAPGLFVGFRHSSTASDTSGFTPVLRDGTTQSTGTTIVATAAKFRIRVDSNNARAYFSVNDGAEQTFGTNFPAITSEMGCTTFANAGGGGIPQGFSLASCEVYW